MVNTADQPMDDEIDALDKRILALSRVDANAALLLLSRKHHAEIVAVLDRVAELGGGEL